MKLKSLVVGAAFVAFSSAAYAGGCQYGHLSMAKVDLKKAPMVQSAKISKLEKIELAAVPTDAWLIKYLT